MSLKADLVFFSKREYSGIRIGWAQEDPTRTWAGLFSHRKDFTRSGNPDLAFGLLPKGGKVLMAATGNVPGEHLEAVEILKAERTPYSEESYLRLVSKGSGIPFSRAKQERISSPILLATVARTETLRKIFGAYESWLYAWDFLLLGLIGDSAPWLSVMKELATQREIDVPRHLIEDNAYLMITAQEHGAYVISNKLSRDMIQGVCEKICRERGFELVVKDQQR